MRLVERLPAVTRRGVFLIVSAAMVAAVIATFYQSALIGWWRGEAKYKGRYTNWWRTELREYYRLPSLSRFGGQTNWCFIRCPTKWERWLAKVLPGDSQTVYQSPPLQDADPESVQVLIELLRAPEPIVRLIAAAGLENIGSPAREAAPALLALVDDEDECVALASRQALRVIQRKFDE
jgi:hypothetical protein